MGDGSVMGGSRGVEGSRGGESWRGVVEGSREWRFPLLGRPCLSKGLSCYYYLQHM
jgi:hypothetical protein